MYIGTTYLITNQQFKTRFFSILNRTSLKGHLYSCTAPNNKKNRNMARKHQERLKMEQPNSILTFLTTTKNPSTLEYIACTNKHLGGTKTQKMVRAGIIWLVWTAHAHTPSDAKQALKEEDSWNRKRRRWWEKTANYRGIEFDGNQGGRTCLEIHQVTG